MDESKHLVMAVTVITEDTASPSNSPKKIGIVLEGVEVIRELGDIPRTCCLLLGLMYALDLNYPKEWKYIFEVFQKFFLDLDASKMSTKVQSLKSKLMS